MGECEDRSQKGINNNANGTKRLAKVSQGTPQNIFWGNEPMHLQKHSVRKEVERSDEAGGQAYKFWLCFIENRLNKVIEK